MPIFRYFAVVGPILLGLLLLADANLPAAGPLNNSTNFYGLQPSQLAQREFAPLSVMAAPAPDMTSASVLAAAPAPDPVAAPIAPTSSQPVAQPEAPPKKAKRVVRQRNWRDDYAAANPWSWRPSHQPRFW